MTLGFRATQSTLLCHWLISWQLMVSLVTKHLARRRASRNRHAVPGSTSLTPQLRETVCLWQQRSWPLAHTPVSDGVKHSAPQCKVSTLLWPMPWSQIRQNMNCRTLEFRNQRGFGKRTNSRGPERHPPLLQCGSQFLGPRGHLLAISFPKNMVVLVTLCIWSSKWPWLLSIPCVLNWPHRSPDPPPAPSLGMLSGRQPLPPGRKGKDGQGARIPCPVLPEMI